MPKKTLSYSGPVSIKPPKGILLGETQVFLDEEIELLLGSLLSKSIRTSDGNPRIRIHVEVSLDE